MAPRQGKEPGSWELDASSPKKDGETRIRRSYCVKGDLITRPAAGINTTYDIVLHAASSHGAKEGFGTRPVERIISEKKKVKKIVDGKEVEEEKEWKYFQLGPYQWITYTEFKDWMGRVATGLYELGMGKREGEDDCFFNIYSMTSVHWQLMAQACASISSPICTAYDTLGPSGLAHAINQPEARGIFTNADLLKTLLSVLDRCPSLTLIVYDGDASADVLDKLRSSREGLRVMKLAEVEELGRKRTGGIVSIPPKTEDICCVMYTSGSTGDPKGVTLTHANMVAAVGAVHHLLYEIFEPTDRYLAYLPLAHILELAVELSWMFVGMPIGYGRVKTLTDASVRGCKGDIAECRPTIMCGVPAVWEAIRKGVTAKIASSSIIVRSLFNLAYTLKLGAIKMGILYVPQIADAIVFNKVKAQTGGRLRYALSGGAAMSRSTQEYLTTTIVTVLQGLGATETVAMCTILPPDFFSFGPAGVPVPSMEIKLVDVKDAGYTSTSNPPRGEICCRGPSLFKGYFKRPDLDAEAFTEDGWFKTGDVGQWNDDGTLTVIDRIKNLIKLSGGEYIALEKLESIYKSNGLVGNMCIFGTSEHPKPIAIVVPHEANFASYLKAHPDLPQNPQEAITSAKIRSAVLAEINRTGKVENLSAMETLSNVVLTLDEWTPESGLVTAAQKIQRKAIESRYKDQINKAFS